MNSAPVRSSLQGLKQLLVLGLCLLLAACSSYPSGPIQGDNKPHAGVARARAMPIQGIDIARYQGLVDFTAARADGIHFAYMKVTEGRDYFAPAFLSNWDRARQAGIARGVYHFMTWCSLASEQAAWFIMNAPNDPDALPPVLDLEWNNHSSCKVKHDKAYILEKVRVMLDAMERHTGKLPIIYTDINFHRDILAGEHFPNAFWLRSTAAEPAKVYASGHFTFWQWTQTGVVRGVKGEVDRNAFYGSQSEWVRFLLSGCDPRAIAQLGPTGRCRSAK